MLQVGPFQFDPASGELRRDGVTTRLRQQPARLLAAMAQQPGAFLSRAEISALLWTDEVHVDTEAGINFVVRQLRSAMGDEAGAPQFIETLPRRGYRLRCEVQPVPPPAVQPTPGRYRWPAAGAAVIGLVLCVSWLVRPGEGPQRLLVQFGTDAAGARYFHREGLRDLIVATLSRPGSGFEVVAPQFADAYLNRPFPEVRRELALDLLLHVSVRDAGGHPQLHAKLVRAGNGAVMWSVNRDYAVNALTEDERAVAEDIARHVSSVPRP